MTTRQGGSFMKRKDGTLERVDFTAPAPVRGVTKAQPNIRLRVFVDERVAKALKHPLDHDGDGRPGGSSAAAALGDATTAGTLAAQAQAGEIDFNTLRTNAARFLGAMPRRKNDIIQALLELSEPK